MMEWVYSRPLRK